MRAADLRDDLGLFLQKRTEVSEFVVLVSAHRASPDDINGANGKFLSILKLLSRCYQQLENALRKRLVDEIGNKFLSLFHDLPHVYMKKEDLVNDFAKFKKVDYDYFDNMFLILVWFYLVLAVPFLLNRILEPFKRRLWRSIRRAGRRWIVAAEAKLIDYIVRRLLTRRRAMRQVRPI